MAGERQKGRRKEWEHIMQKKTGILIVVAGVLLLLFTMNPMNIFRMFNSDFPLRPKINEEKTLAADDFRICPYRLEAPTLKSQKEMQTRLKSG